MTLIIHTCVHSLNTRQTSSTGHQILRNLSSHICAVCGKFLLFDKFYAQLRLRYQSNSVYHMSANFQKNNFNLSSHMVNRCISLTFISECDLNKHDLCTLQDVQRIISNYGLNVQHLLQDINTAALKTSLTTFTWTFHLTFDP